MERKPRRNHLIQIKMKVTIIKTPIEGLGDVYVTCIKDNGLWRSAVSTAAQTEEKAKQDFMAEWIRYAENHDNTQLINEPVEFVSE